jgi:hypothetical protein
LSTEWLGIVLLGVLFGAIFIGFPIAFTLIAVGAIGGYLALGPLALHLMTLQLFSVMRDPTLASVPFFLFMGYLLEQSGLMERLFRGIQLALGAVRGSLYLAVLLTATIFAAATGIVGSSVTLLGVMAAPAMKRSGYDIRMSAGAITAGGTLGILIPPSVMLIVMGTGRRRAGDRSVRRRGDPRPAALVPVHRLHARAELPRPVAGSRAPARGARRVDRPGGARARVRHRAGGRRDLRDARRDPGRHRDADRRRRGRRVRGARPDARLPAHDLEGIQVRRVLDAAHELHDPAARSRRRTTSARCSRAWAARR